MFCESVVWAESISEKTLVTFGENIRTENKQANKHKTLQIKASLAGQAGSFLPEELLKCLRAGLCSGESL